MHSTSEIVHCYGQLVSTMSRMLELARVKEWGRLPALDAQCTSIVDRLRAIEPHDRLGPQERARVHELMSRARADQVELSNLIRPQLARLVRTLDELQRQQNVNRAYRPLP